MPRKGHRTEKPISGNTANEKQLGTLLRTYLGTLEVRNYASGTINKYRCHLNHFVDWAEERSLVTATEITRPHLERYQRHLFQSLDRCRKRLSFNNQHQRLTAIRSWFKWMTRQRHVLHNPASEIELPKLAQRLPKHILNHQEVEDILNTTNLKNIFGIRDRAIMETLYSTGIRRMELINLLLPDVDHERGVLTVRLGKGKKDRIVPIGARALAWTRTYTEQVRPQLVVEETESALYLTKFGLPFSGSSLSAIVGRYIDESPVAKTGSCHLFRHTMATVMHENGADIRHIQAILGHARLDTTQIYTQVAIKKLKQIHENTHPAKLGIREDNPPS